MVAQNVIGLAVAVVIIAGIIFYLQNPLTPLPSNKGSNIGLNIGQQAPDFELEDVNGKIVKLSDFKGKKSVFLNFWASWCPFCVDEMPDIQNAFEKYENTMVVLAVNRGEPKAKAIDFVTNNLRANAKITYPILLDPDEKVSRIYILYGMPVSYFIDRDGIIKDRKFGPLTVDEINEKVKKIV